MFSSVCVVWARDAVGQRQAVGGAERARHEQRVAGLAGVGELGRRPRPSTTMRSAGIAGR